MPDPTYSITGWNEHFENAASRKYKDTRWVPLPNRFDGERITSLICDGGTAVYGAWCGVVLIASRCCPRGLLVKKNGQPHNAKSLARMTKLEEKYIAKMLILACEIGLLDSSPPQAQHEPTLNPTQAQRIEENRREEKEENTSCPEPQAASGPESEPVMVFECVGPESRFRLTPDKLAEWVECYPNMDVPADLRAARQWVEDNPGKRKTARGMTRFLGGWLQRTNDKPKGFNNGKTQQNISRVRAPEGKYANTAIVCDNTRPPDDQRPKTGSSTDSPD